MQKRKIALKQYQQNGFSFPERRTLNGITFEASIHYYHHKSARDNLFAILPCSKIIWMLRNPLPRALSEYLHQAVKSKKYPPFISVVQAEVKATKKCYHKNTGQGFDFKAGFENRLFKCLSNFKLKKYSLSTGFYAYFIYAWIEKFPIDQHLFLNYDEFRRNPEATLRKISEFLAIEAPPKLDTRWKYNKANTRDGIAAKIRNISSVLPVRLLSEITKLLHPQVTEIYKVTGENFQWKLDSLS